jgi:RNA polymerase-binding transcription factor DksA
MNAHKHEVFRQQLEALAARMRPDAQSVASQTLGPASGQGTTELSNVPMHLGDAGTDEFLHDMNAALLENQSYLLNEVDAALDRIQSGAFGACERCGKAIAMARLEAIPYTRFCIACAASNDETPAVNLDQGRPRSPDDTYIDEEEMEITRRNEKSRVSDMLTSQNPSPRTSDGHAAGEAGGGTAIGGLAGSTLGDGTPNSAELETATGSGHFDKEEGADEIENAPVADRQGRATSRVPHTRR